MASISQDIGDGRTHHQAGRLEEAEAAYSGVLESEPENAEARHLMGVLAYQRGQFDAATGWFERAIESDGGNTKYLGNLGAALVSGRRFGDALPHLEQATGIDSEAADILNSLGEAYRGLGRFDEAVAAYQRAVAAESEYPELHANLAVALMQAGRLDEALASAAAAAAAGPDSAEIHNTLGTVLITAGRIAEAEAAFRRAAELAPDFAEAQRNLGLALIQARRFEDAKTCYRGVIAEWPRDGAAFAGLARAFQLQGRIEESLPIHRKAAELAPDNASYHSNLVFALQSSAEADGAEIYAEHRDWNERHAVKLRPPVAVYDNVRDVERRLRLGYVSGDFQNHPVGRLALPVLTQHDRDGFELFCYSQRRGGDAITDRFRDTADTWRETAGLNDAALADAIRADGIDILVDLAGHTARGRLASFARRPAPVQIAWLGYPGTTGLDVMDYVIGDPVQTPEGCEDQFSERILRMPHDLVCFDPPSEAPEVGPLPAGESGPVTFGVFNNARKITDPAVALWAGLLEAVPGARLILKSRANEDRATRDYMLSRLTGNGVDPDRVEFVGGTSYTDLLGTYNRVDIALDTFPYSGAMTTLEALWMGVPVIALAGARMAARSTAAHLAAVGLTELTAADEDGYLAIARDLAGDHERLAQLRAGMRARLKGSALCDGKSFTRDLEALYRIAWREWCTGPQA